MYHFVCFILLVSLEGLKAQNISTNNNETSTHISVTNTSAVVSSPLDTTNNFEPTSKKMSMALPTKQQEPIQPGCLFNLSDNKEVLLWLIISLLSAVCLLLLVIMFLVCRFCRGVRNDDLDEKNMYKPTRKNSVNGGPSETEVMLKKCSSVKVETETTPDESQEPEEVGGATDQIEYQVSGEENQTLTDDTSETAPTQDANQSDKTDLKMEDLEKAE